jgi:hypothetical protein
MKQKYSRWSEVRDPDDELVVLTVYRKSGERWCGGSPSERARDETHGSRGRTSPAVAAMLVQPPTLLWFFVDLVAGR